MFVRSFLSGSMYPASMRVTGLDLPPPSCLSSVRATRAEGEFRRKLVEQFISDAEDAASLARHRMLARSEAWVSTREELEVWRVGCPCGEDQGKIVGVGVRGELSAPLFYACRTCGLKSLLFHPSLHGYNAEIAKRKRKPRKDVQATAAVHCRICKTTVWFPAIIVTYQGEPPNISQGQRLQDLFDVILVGGVCVGCGHFALRYDEECA